MIPTHDVIVIGAGAAGLMCGGVAAGRGRKTLILDHAKKIGEKIRISGGGRCNFTNIYASPENFLSQNPHFCKSALKQYTQYDFIDWVEQSGIAYHEKKLGQLFCDESSQQIIDMLVNRCRDHGAEIRMETSVTNITKENDLYVVESSTGTYAASSLVVACGGLSIPKIGASGFGYDIARQFGHSIVDTRAALVPLTFQSTLLTFCKSISGLSVEASVQASKTTFDEGLLFTHRGLSGPSILQISSYWDEGTDITVNLNPDCDAYEILNKAKAESPKKSVRKIIQDILPKRLADQICDAHGLGGNIAELSDTRIAEIANAVNAWSIRPDGTEGYRTAEVTLGGVNTNELSSKSMESKLSPGLYFIGEVVDVTGWLGGYNFQWAWSSGYVAGTNV
jgi:hypothetical protein